MIARLDFVFLSFLPWRRATFRRGCWSLFVCVCVFCGAVLPFAVVAGPSFWFLVFGVSVALRPFWIVEGVHPSLFE